MDNIFNLIYDKFASFFFLKSFCLCQKFRSIPLNELFPVYSLSESTAIFVYVGAFGFAEE